MKNKLIALLLIIISYKLNAKNDSTAVIKSGIGVTLSPMVSFLINDNYSFFDKNTLSHSAGFSFTAGISSNLVVSKKIQTLYRYRFRISK